MPNSAMSPGFVWLKERSTTGDHELFDSVRGVHKYMESNSTNAESTSTTTLTSFDSNGFTLGSSSLVNDNNVTYAGWAWDAGSSTTTIAAGSLNSSAYNQSQTWSNLVTGTLETTYGNSSPAAPFQGTTGSSYADGIRPTNGNYLSMNFGTTFASATTVRIYGHASLDGAAYTGANENLKINGTALTAAEWANNGGGTGSGQQNATFTLSSGLTSLEWGYSSGSQSTGYLYLQAIEVDGKLLTNSGVTPPNVPSIASTVRASAASGFSSVSYTGTGANATFGHGLNAAPEMVIIKQRNGTGFWVVGHKDLPFTNDYYMSLNTSDAVSTGAGGVAWQSTAPTSSVVTIGTSGVLNGSGNTHIAYCFAPVAGYSAMGSYQGNGSADGSFVFTGFKIAWLLIKRTDATKSWQLIDNARSTFNVTDDRLFPDDSAAESNGSNFNLDFLSNGFKCRTAHNSTNESGGTYIYLALASHPFASNGGLAR